MDKQRYQTYNEWRTQAPIGATEVILVAIRDSGAACGKATPIYNQSAGSDIRACSPKNSAARSAKRERKFVGFDVHPKSFKSRELIELIYRDDD